MAAILTTGGFEDLEIERALYERAADAASPRLAELFRQLRGDVAHLTQLRARLVASLPSLDEAQSIAVDAQRLTASEQDAASKAVRRLDDLDDAETLWVLLEVIRGALDEEQMFGFLYESAPEVYRQILERRHIMLRRIQTVTS